MNNSKEKQNNAGFTLIEIMVSVAIFAIIMTTGIGSLVSITNSYRASQQNKQVNDALNYSLESMTREIRLGHNYHVNTDSNQESDTVDGQFRDSLGFSAAEGRGYIIYRLNEDTLTLERVRDGEVSELTNSELVEIRNIQFTVLGTDTPAETGDLRQPLVWIQIQASSPGSENISTIQTLVSQRLLDV